MADRKNKTSGINAEREQFIEAFKVSIDYVEPVWEDYIRFYEYWRGIKPVELDSTISGIWLNIFHQLVQNRLPLLFENVFSHPEYLTLESDSPEYDFSRLPAQMWLRNLLDDKIKIRSSAHQTLLSACIGGTGFRMPYVRYVNKGGRMEPIITSRDVNFFSALPSPNGYRINPDDYNSDNAVDWMFVIDWWSEDQIKALGSSEEANKDQIGKLLNEESGRDTYEEDNYKNRFKTINGQSFDGYGQLYRDISNLPKSIKKRRVVHWFRRDKHIIVAEDAYVIFSGKTPFDDGTIPLVKYSASPDLNSFYGISQLELVEDLVMAMIMNFNYRMDHMLGVMFPTTWIRDDLKRGKTKDDFIPRPYSVNHFPSSVNDIRNAIYYDRRPEVSQQTFVDEDRMKSWLQGIAGELETTGSMQDVVGNKTASGVTTIASQLKARPNMEAAILEETGFREEATLLLRLGDKHINRPVTVRTPGGAGNTPWQRVSPHDITDKFTVRMHGAKYHMDKQMSFQKMLALYPLWNGKPGINQFELDSQALSVADVFPQPEKIVAPPAPPPPEMAVRPSAPTPASPAGPGGAASSLDLNQSARGVRERTTVEPGTGRQVRAF